MQSALTDIDTRTVVPAERFAYWLETFARVVVPLEVRSDHVADFAATVRVLDLGAALVGVHRYPPLEAHRTPKLIQSDDPGPYQLLLNVRGEVRAVQCHRTAWLNASEFTLLDCARPFDLTHTRCRWDAGQPEAITVSFAHRLLPVPADRAAQLTGLHMSSEDGMGALLWRFLRELTSHPQDYRPPDLARLGTITLDLLVATLAHRLEPDPVSGSAPDQAMLARVHAFVDRRIADPELSPRMIAAAHHISPRTLHRLFHSGGTTVTQWIRSRRLERCRHDLADNLKSGSSIGAISTRWGFRDGAHFSRAFRAEYGLSPHAFRESQKTCGST